MVEPGVLECETKSGFVGRCVTSSAPSTATRATFFGVVVPPPTPLPTRLWSYALLKRSDVLVPVNDSHEEDLTRIGSVWLEHYSPEHGGGHVMKAGPSEQAIARWLFGLLAIAPGYLDRHPLRTRKVTRVFESFIELDRIHRHSRRAARAAGAPTAEQRIAAMHNRKRLAADSRPHSRRLRAAMRYGLKRRVGRLLEGDEDVWLAFAARGFKVPGLRVCEQCSIVFPALRAERCPSCRRSPVVPNLAPVEDGGWHLDFRVGGRWSSGEFDRTITYTSICRECGRRFDTPHPGRQLCHNCGSGSGRVRRHRSSPSSTGRITFAYVSADGGPLLSAGVTGPDGQGIVLFADEGVLRVTDREYVRQLDANPSLRRAESENVIIPRDGASS